jgi:drug/metabolite transporter (DMT)-like permease
MRNIWLYLIAVLVWGSTWFAIEFQLGAVAPEVSIVYRYTAAALLLFAWCRYRKLNLKFSVREHGWFVLLGILLFGLNYVLSYRAQVYITSALAAIVFSSIVWMNIVNARLFYGIRAGRRTLFGSLLGVAGIFTLFAPQVSEIAFTDAVFFGSVLSVMGAVVSSLGNMASQGAQKRGLPVVQSNAWGMLYGAVLSGIFSVAAGHTFTFDWSVGYIVSLAYLTVFGSVIAFGAYLTLLGRIGAHKAGYAMVLFPVVALMLSIVFEGLELSLSIVIGTLLVLVGNVFVLERKAQAKREVTPARPQLASTES